MVANMGKNIIVMFMIILFLSIFAILPAETSETTNGNILYVGGSGTGNYSIIQSAIENSSDGDIINVYNGTYYENLEINKKINLIGENKSTTIIDGSGIDDVITIIADNTTVTNLTIQNSGYIFPRAGINVSSNYNILSGNDILNNYYGFTLFQAKSNIISENMISNNDHCGIYMSGSSNNIIRRNAIEYHKYNGIGIYDASNTNNITENSITHNDFCGINIYTSSNNKITGNTITDNNVGIHVPPDKYENHILDNTFSNNENNIEKESGISFIEFAIAITVLVCLTVFVLFWREKSQKKAPKSKGKEHYLDTRGNLCPIPLIMTKKKIAKMKKGVVLEIITTDLVAKENIERFGITKHELKRIDKEGEIFKIFIKK